MPFVSWIRKFFISYSCISMAISRQKKSEILAVLKDQMTRQQSVVFFAYRGTNVKDVNVFRSEVFAGGMTYHVAKKTLICKAAKDAAKIDVDAVALGKVPFGALFGFDDQISAPKLAAKFAKSIETFDIVGGIIDGKHVDAATIKQYADLPSREELLAKIAGLMRAPLTGFHGAIKSSITGFARAVGEYAKTKDAA
jgi:large subunit ribosomal protein L10